MIADTFAALEPRDPPRPRRRSDRLIAGIAVLILALLGLGVAGSCMAGALAARVLNREPIGQDRTESTSRLN